MPKNNQDIQKVAINTDTIQLDQFLKWAGVVEAGGHVKLMIEDGMILTNGVLETARRRRLKPGDIIEIKEIGCWQVVKQGE